MAKGPRITDIKLLIQAGINPKTGLPLKWTGGNEKKPELKSSVKRYLRIVDEQRAINRYKWYNLPASLSSQELERLLYYKGQLCFFYEKYSGEFYFMPYALDGTIDFYGRFNTIHPVPMTSGGTEKEKAQVAQMMNVLSQMKLKVIKDMIVFKDEITEDLLMNSAVILRDYTNQQGQENIARYLLNDELLDVMSDCIPFLRTSMILGTGVEGIRVADADSESEVEAASQSMYSAALNGNPYMPIVGKVDFQDLSSKSALKAQEFMLTMQSIDNLLLAGYGIDNGGLFEKKAHELETEAAINNAPVGLVFQDGLSQRQNFCNIVNSIWGLGIWCEPTEAALSFDVNGDGMPLDEDPEGAQSGASLENGGEE